jgi:hypothetical protein
VVLLAPLLAFVTCSSDEPPPRGVSEGCLINTDCNSPLVCAFQRCHVQCKDSRDCDAGQRCVVSDRPFHVCQLDGEKSCAYNSACPNGQACGIDGQCRDVCRADRDCLAGQVCATGTCAETVELLDGGLPMSAEAGPPSGQPCAYDSDCASPFVCRSGFCGYQCFTSRDCGRGQTCVAQRCEGTGACVDERDCDEGFECTDNRCRLRDSIGTEGGTFHSLDGRIDVIVPAGALSEGRIRLTARVADTAPPGARGPVYELGPSGTIFLKAVTVTYHFQASELGVMAPADMRLATSSSFSWIALAGSSLDATAQTVSGTTFHFSAFGIIPSATSGNCSQTVVDLLPATRTCLWSLPGAYDPQAGEVVVYLQGGKKEVPVRLPDAGSCFGDAGEQVPGWYYQDQTVNLCPIVCSNLSDSGLEVWYSSGCRP